tara:strand:- start:212 stop:1006 length:795 start_codon:yes stop_codon:yes gene_type:complete
MNLQNKISNWLSNYLSYNNLDTFVVGISGGIDSAVTSTLCAMTGMKTIVAVMPIHQNPEETLRGADHCRWLKDKYPNVEQVNLELSKIYENFLIEVPSKYHTKLSLANTKARIRMTSLYTLAGGSNGIVVGTGNKVEDFGVGFFTKYGDGGVDISPIADLMKSEVYQLGKDLGIIESIIKAKPTDGLWDDGRTDEDQMGASYDELEWAMEKSEEPLIPNVGLMQNYESFTDRQLHVLKVYREHRDSNMHKMKSIPIFKKDEHSL